jgi:WXG100 family type VII secretion target
MTIRFENHEFHASVADVRQASAAIAGARARASGQVSALLDGGWTGAAADAFGEAWRDWLSAAAAVSADLEALAGLLADVHQDLSEVDAVVTCGFGQLAGRLG